MKLLNENDFSFIDPMLIILKNIKTVNESTLLTEEEKEVKKKGLFVKVVKALFGKNLTEDEDVGSIYSALSAVMSANYILGKIPVLGIVPKITAKHLMTGTLPKYRKKLMKIYMAKEKEMNIKLKEIRSMIEDENNEDRKELLREHEVAIKQAKALFAKEYKRIAVFDDRVNKEEDE